MEEPGAPWRRRERATGRRPPPELLSQGSVSEEERQLGFQVGLAAFPLGCVFCPRICQMEAQLEIEVGAKDWGFSCLPLFPGNPLEVSPC